MNSSKEKLRDEDTKWEKKPVVDLSPDEEMLKAESQKTDGVRFAVPESCHPVRTPLS